MPTMWWMETERQRLANEGDLEGAAMIAAEQLEMIFKGGYRPPVGSQCPTCGVEVEAERETYDEVGDGKAKAEKDAERRRKALKALQRRLFT